MDAQTLKFFLDVINTSALIAMVLLFVNGWLVSRPTLERHILAPRDARIEALERAMARKEEEAKETLRQAMSTIEVMGKALDRLTPERKGGD